MDGISYGGALFGLALGAFILWGSIFAFAYGMRRFGGSARSYFTGFAIAWFATVLFFVLLTVWENRPSGS